MSKPIVPLPHGVSLANSPSEWLVAHQMTKTFLNTLEWGHMMADRESGSPAPNPWGLPVVPGEMGLPEGVQAGPFLLDQLVELWVWGRHGGDRTRQIERISAIIARKQSALGLGVVSIGPAEEQATRTLS